MRLVVLAMTTAVALAGCGTTQGDRGLSGAMIGGGIGLVGGGVGVLGGALIGAVVGMVTEPSAINLGTPIWRQ